MKCIVTMKRMVRLAVGSLCLLALMVNAAPAADPPPKIYCFWGDYRSENTTKGGLWTAEVSLSNIDQVAQQFLVIVVPSNCGFA